MELTPIQTKKKELQESKYPTSKIGNLQGEPNFLEAILRVRYRYVYVEDCSLGVRGPEGGGRCWLAEEHEIECASFLILSAAINNLSIAFLYSTPSQNTFLTFQFSNTLLIFH